MNRRVLLVLVLLPPFVYGLLATTADRPDRPPPALAAPPRCGDGPRLDPSLVGYSPGSSFFGDGLTMTADLAAMAESGATWVRLDLDWSWVERDRGAADWRATDAALPRARAAGLRVLLVVSATPTWARPPGTGDKTPPLEAGDFAAFLTRAVERYGPDVAAWQVWNEPNIERFWQPAPDPQAYAELLVAATAAIRTVDPDAVVVTAGLAPAADTPDGSERDPVGFLADLARTGALDGVDAVGVHPYSFPALPGDEAPWNLFGRLAELRAHAVGADGRALPLWLTEFGYPTGDHPNAVDETVQAQGILDALVASQADGSTGPLFVYSDRDRDDEADPGGFGVRDLSGAPKPAWLALQEALRCPVRGADGPSEG